MIRLTTQLDRSEIHHQCTSEMCVLKQGTRKTDSLMTKANQLLLGMNPYNVWEKTYRVSCVTAL